MVFGWGRKWQCRYFNWRGHNQWWCTSVNKSSPAHTDNGNNNSHPPPFLNIREANYEKWNQKWKFSFNKIRRKEKLRSCSLAPSPPLFFFTQPPTQETHFNKTPDSLIDLETIICKGLELCNFALSLSPTQAPTTLPIYST